MEIHYATDRIAAVGHGTGAMQHLRTFDGIGIHTDHILQVAAAIDGVVHAHAIHHDQHAVRGEPAQHGTAATELAALHEHLTAALKQIGGCARVGEGHIAGLEHRDVFWYTLAVLLPAVGTYSKFSQGEGLRFHRHTVLQCCDLLKR